MKIRTFLLPEGFARGTGAETAEISFKSLMQLELTPTIKYPLIILPGNC
jgi:hypothetical protein